MHSFKSINIYFDKDYNLIGVPSTINEKWHMIQELDCVCLLNVPYDYNQIEEFLLEVFLKCYSQPAPDINQISGLRKYLGVRSHNAAVKNRGLVSLTWLKDKGYTITPTWKNAKLKNAFNYMEGLSIVLKSDYKINELAYAFLEVMQKSQIEPLSQAPVN